MSPRAQSGGSLAKNISLLRSPALDQIAFQMKKDIKIPFAKNLQIVATKEWDKDFLTQNERKELMLKHQNYIILEYYCFENYLYHPENLKELDLVDFEYDKYKNEIKQQVNSKRDSILLKLKNSRNSYLEFKNTEDGINHEKNAEQIIISALDSDDIESYLKFFNMKDEFNKSILSKLNLTTDKLISTKWFKSRIREFFEFTNNP